MGKRQIGELQPTELVVTILISEVASIPLEDTDAPLLSSFLPIAVIICLELIISGLSLKSVRFRRIFTGKPIIVIDDGKIDQKALKSTRISVSDLLDNLRLKGYFDVQTVKYAVVEMNGQISVMPKETDAPLTLKDMKMTAQKKEIPFTIISDGEIVRGHFDELNIGEKDVYQQLKKEHLNLNEVMLMTCNRNREYFTLKRDETL